MVASSTMDPESVGLLRDYVNKLFEYVLFNALDAVFNPTTQVHGGGARTTVPKGIRAGVAGVPEHLQVVKDPRFTMSFSLCFAVLLCWNRCCCNIIVQSSVLQVQRATGPPRHLSLSIPQLESGPAVSPSSSTLGSLADEQLLTYSRRVNLPRAPITGAVSST